MKIRTDFVTNSSSSSFTSYRIGGKQLKDFMERFHVELESDRDILDVDVKYDPDSDSYVLECSGDDASIYPSLLKLMQITTTTKKDRDINYDCYDYEDREKFRRPIDHEVHYEDYTIQTNYDGTAESMFRLLEELFTNTDFSKKIWIEGYRIWGGSECWDGGESETIDSDGDIICYQRLSCGESYSYDDCAVLEDYNRGTLDIMDEWESISYDDSDVEEAIQRACKSKPGLQKIRSIFCINPDSNITKISVPECVEQFGKYANECCNTLKQIIFYGKNIEIGEHAIPEGVLIIGHPGSTAEEYAKANGNEFISLDALIEENASPKRSEMVEHPDGSEETYVAENENHSSFKTGQSERAIYKKNCVIIEHIPSFKDKTFVSSGIYEKRYDSLKSFLTEQGAFLRKQISGRTDYLIVDPEETGRSSGGSKYRAILEQADKGHTIKVIFYEDFAKQMNAMKQQK